MNSLLSLLPFAALVLSEATVVKLNDQIGFVIFTGDLAKGNHSEAVEFCQSYNGTIAEEVAGIPLVSPVLTELAWVSKECLVIGNGIQAPVATPCSEELAVVCQFEKDMKVRRLLRSVQRDYNRKERRIERSAEREERRSERAQRREERRAARKIERGKNREARRAARNIVREARREERAQRKADLAENSE